MHFFFQEYNLKHFELKFTNLINKVTILSILFPITNNTHFDTEQFNLLLPFQNYVSLLGHETN